MSTHFSTAVQVKGFNLSSTSNDNDDSVVSTASSISDSEIENNETSTSETTSEPVVTKKNADIEANVKPVCPPSVNHIINTLSAVSTFCGLGLIITGGMGMTLNKPIDNTVENVAMILSGGTLLAGSWIGTVVYANNQAT